MDVSIGRLRAALVGSAAALTLAGAPPVVGAPAPSPADQACLGCHGQAGLKKTFRKGGSISLEVKGAAFAASVHGPMGCTACHAEVDLKSHPGAGKAFDTARNYSLAKAQACNTCHADKAQLFEGSVHAGVLRAGNLAAPVCTDCHGAHEVARRKPQASLKEVSCRGCHSAIFDAYAGSMHGQAFGKAGAAKAPICADCHRAHDVSPASSGTRLREACLGCHSGAPAAHEQWLPNTKLHMQAVACAACHAPAARKRVDLRLYDPAAKRNVTEKEGQAALGKPPRPGETGGVELDAKALAELVRGAQREGTNGRMTLVGRLEVRTGPEAHQLTGKAKAVRDCVVCHRKGADPFQNVTISIIGEDGRPVRYEAQREVLDDPASVASVSGFYAIGATRIGMLDALLALVLFAGISAPLVHLVVRRLLRRKRDAERRGDAPR